MRLEKRTHTPPYNRVIVGQQDSCHLGS
jgi:hypothetical protein